MLTYKKFKILGDGVLESILVAVNPSIIMVTPFFVTILEFARNDSANGRNGSVHLAYIIMLLCTSTKRLNQFLTCCNVQLFF
jgi:hypothetical protein